MLVRHRFCRAIGQLPDASPFPTAPASPARNAPGTINIPASSATLAQNSRRVSPECPSRFGNVVKHPQSGTATAPCLVSITADSSPVAQTTPHISSGLRP